MTEDVKKEFRENQYTNDDASKPALTRKTKRGSGAATGTKAGQELHFAINKYIKNQSEKLTPKLKQAKNIVEKVKLFFRNYEKSKPKEEIKNDNPNPKTPKNDNPKERIELLQSEFPLVGYMIHEIKNERPEIYYWKGDADAIGWYKENYVIIDWKVVDAPKFWEHSDAYGKHLHQCLAYAWLLKLHLELPKLPYILIVPIDESTQKDIEPGLFYDYPKECKDKLHKYKWSTTLDQSKLKVPMSLPRDLIQDNVKPDVNDFVNTSMKLENVFKPGCTVNELLNALARCDLKIEL
jgi:hypothetical protein